MPERGCPAQCSSQPPIARVLPPTPAPAPSRALQWAVDSRSLGGSSQTRLPSEPSRDPPPSPAHIWNHSGMARSSQKFSAPVWQGGRGSAGTRTHGLAGPWHVAAGSFPPSWDCDLSVHSGSAGKPSWGAKAVRRHRATVAQMGKPRPRGLHGQQRRWGWAPSCPMEAPRRASQKPGRADLGLTRTLGLQGDHSRVPHSLVLPRLSL